MNKIIKILTIFGTRPEAIKMATLVNALSDEKRIESKLCVTAQQRQMLDQVLHLFEIKPDFDLDLMKNNQDLTDITSNVLLGLRDILRSWHPDLVLVHGDTSTTLAASMAAFYEKIPVGHIEAGLRTSNIYSPWPEEMNRRLVSTIATFHFSPTESAKLNLLREGISPNSVIVTGNTVIDSLFVINKRINNDSVILNSLKQKFNFIDSTKKLILVTGHRRENFGQGFINICNALLDIAKRNDVQIVYPVHLNPNVQQPVKRLLSSNNRIVLIEPQDYLPFVYLMGLAHIIITDSGGIQEEAPSLGKPVLVMRNTTERPEAEISGTVRLIGTERNKILEATNYLLDNQAEYERMSCISNPYGSGDASKKILDFLLKTINE